MLRAPRALSSVARLRRAAEGYTFAELLIVVTLLLILASATMPLVRVSMQRQREAELRIALREMRIAIDRYKEAADRNIIAATYVRAGSEGYPADLKILVDGVPVANDASGKRLKLLRRIPLDPITNSTDWGLRSYQDRPDASSWGGQNVFDVYTKARGKGLNGIPYREW